MGAFCFFSATVLSPSHSSGLFTIPVLLRVFPKDGAQRSLQAELVAHPWGTIPGPAPGSPKNQAEATE